MASYPHSAKNASLNEGLAPAGHLSGTSVCRRVKRTPMHLSPPPSLLLCPPHPGAGRQGFPEDGRTWRRLCSHPADMGWQGARVPRKPRKAQTASCHLAPEGGQPLCVGVDRGVKRELQKSQDWSSRSFTIWPHPLLLVPFQLKATAI